MTIGTYLKNMARGLLIGVSMLVPGVSGGTMAVIFGIYDDLLAAISNLFRQFRKSIFILSSVGLGGLIGFTAAAHLISTLLEVAYQPTLYFFIGTILGGVFLLWRQNRREQKKYNLPMLLIGIGIVIAMQLIPEDILLYNGNSLLVQFMIMVAIGLLLAAALILPGISFSMMLVIIGIYARFIDAVETLDVIYLAPIGLCTLFGVIVLSKALYLFMKRYGQLCDSLIIGFVIASIGEIYPGLPHGVDLVLNLALSALGFALSWFAVITLPFCDTGKPR